MKRIYITFLLIIYSSLVFSQGYGGTSFEGIFNAASVLDMSPVGKQYFSDKAFSEEEKRKILELQYMTSAYNPALIDSFTTTAYLRYNLYNDQMEFVKNDQIYYLQKQKGRRVHFTALNKTYKVFELYGDLNFFMVKVDGKNSLLVRQEKRFVKPEKPKSQYQKEKKATFKSKKDVYYLALGNSNLMKLSGKKKEFPKAFVGKESEIKAFVKKNKLNPKKLEDIAKVVAYFNTL